MASSVDRHIAHLEEIVEKALRSMQNNAARKPPYLPAQHEQSEALKFLIESANAELADSSSTSAAQKRCDSTESNTVQK